MFGIMQQNFKPNQRVMIGQTSDPELDGATGSVIGVAVRNVPDIYIVSLDKPLSYTDFEAITMPEVCLSPIEAT